ncbi:cobalamin B12-binding domain-containing protein [Streptomyces durbertensis]|uniref:Cobalamin B12-binding domain-containing protein n=1 Tax=Streptomyces durbertensis TaxID=2448886 RepID=A0ABR6ELC9_9ACTN|nr:cobalamin-dependent protein [Streptomyces durbertensis]MBB1246145.1 cobalamin B12-binding domain-containing protein [Streptomyces durbertensis]
MTGTSPGGLRLPEAGLSPPAEAFFEAVAAADEPGALTVVRRALEVDTSAEEVLLEVIGPAQARVGEEWAAARLSVAEEHAATAISDRAIAFLSFAVPEPRSRHAPVRGRVTVACGDGEWHALPARLVAETLRLRGWRVDYLGANVPTTQLVLHLHTTGADAVALSCSVPVRLPGAHAAITACQSVGVPVLAGGAGFGPDGRHARTLGADMWAPSAPLAAERLAARSAGGLAAAPRLPSDPADRLPHLADQEYTHLRKSYAPLVAAMITRLRERHPEAAGYDARQLRLTHEDLGHLVDFLTAALYVDDSSLMTEFLVWTANVLRPRGVPARLLTAGLDALAAELREFPRATAMIAEGRLALTGSTQEQE